MSEEAAAEALDAYVEALLRGEALDPDAWLHEHPDFDVALREELELVASLQRAADSVALDSRVELDEPGAEESAPPRRLLSPGTRLGEHVIEELLGAGGMGEVYRATHEVLGREVAIKVLRPYLADEPEAAARFRQEVKTLASLGPHPNVVAALHASEHEGRLYLVMEHVPGTSLSRLVRDEGPVSPERARSLIAQAASGLAHAHRGGIVHRDVKPSNLLLTPDGALKVVDLGLARLGPRDEGPGRTTWVDELVGSLDYMAPEQAHRPDEADARSDLYALGCTLYFLLEGRAPFADRLALKKLMAHAVDPPPPLRSEVPAGLRAVLARLLEKEPARRYASAEELVDALEALPALGPVGLASDPGRVTAPTWPAPLESGAPSRWRIVALLAVVLLLAGAGVAVFVALRPSSPGLGLDAPVQGRLEEGDGVRPKERAWFDAHPMRVEAGTTYVWTLRSRALDPALLLRRDGWEIDASDDAPGLGEAAQIVWTADRTGEVEVVATTPREQAGGGYLLSAEVLTLPALVPGAEREGRLEPSDARLAQDDSLLDRYWLRVTAGETLVLRMEAEGFAPFLFVENEDRVMIAGSRADGGDAHEARLVHVADRSGVVFVGANAARPGASGAYRISAASEEAGREVLRASGTLADGDLVLGDGSLYDEHPLPTVRGHTYVITMRSEELDTFLLLVAPDDERVAQNDDALGTDSRIVYRAHDDLVMRVFANSYASGMQGSYTLVVRDLDE